MVELYAVENLFVFVLWILLGSSFSDLPISCFVFSALPCTRLHTGTSRCRYAMTGRLAAARFTVARACGGWQEPAPLS